MIYFCNKIESLVRLILIKIKLIYYKIKYGKRFKYGRKLRFRKGFRLFIDKNAYVNIGNNVFFNQYYNYGF